MSYIQELINAYELLPHPEGGYYKETYRSVETIASIGLPFRFTSPRPFSTAIYFLLDKGNFSAFHRIKSDECWHFYTGQTLLVHIIHFDGSLQTIKLGNRIEEGEVFQYVVPARCWFASEPAPDTEYAFTGCTVSPGFDFADFELAAADQLTAQFPQHEALIKRLCR